MRMRELRRKRDWTAQRLADEMVRVGLPWKREIVANLETGRRTNITVEELLGLAYVLSVAPVHLLVPPLPSRMWGEAAPNDPNDTDTELQVTPALSVPLYRVRQFIRGARPLPGVDARLFYTEVPPHEFQELNTGDLEKWITYESEQGDGR